MDASAQPGPAVAVSAGGGRHARPVRHAGPEHQVARAERGEDPIPRHAVEPLPGDALDDPLEEDVPHVAVDQALAGQSVERLARDRGVQSGLSTLIVPEGIHRRESRRVCEDPTQAPGSDLRALRLLDVALDRVVEVQRAFEGELHNEQGGHDGFGQRGEVEDGAQRHGLDPRPERAPAQRRLVKDAAAPSDRDHRSRHEALRDPRMEERVERLEGAGSAGLFAGPWHRRQNSGFRSPKGFRTH